MGGMEGINGRRNEQQSDRAENHDQNEPYLGRFEVEKVKFLMLNALCIYLELCFLPRQGAHFQKIRLKSGQKLKNGAKIMLDTSKDRQNGVGYMKISSKLCRICL